MDCYHCEATLPASPLIFEGKPTCGRCISRIEKHRKASSAPVVDPTADWPASERGERCFDWITRNAELALMAMPAHEREEWIRVDEWRRKQSAKKQVGPHARHWSFTHLIR